MTTRGTIFIAAGAEYDALAANTIGRSRKYIPENISVTVLSNLKTRSPKWNSIPGVNIIYLDMPDDARAVRTQLIKYTPYDETLYVDCDSVFTKPGIEKIFDLFGDNDAIFQQYGAVWTKEKRYYQIYRDAVKLFGCSLPFTIYIGGFFAFKKTAACEPFFDLWHSFWKRHGIGRDMPALCCAIQKSGIKHVTITKSEHKFFSFGMKSDAIILHRVKVNDLNKYFGIPPYESNKCFDIGKSWFWNMVYIDDRSNEIMNDPFIKSKFNPDIRYADNKKYIDKYLPEIRAGGLDILDIACGPGELMELAMQMNCRATGIDNYSKMLDRRDDRLYGEYSKMMIAEKGLHVIAADINDVITDGHAGLIGAKFDIINCKHAVNFMAGKLFNWKCERGEEYKNDGEWILDDKPAREVNCDFYEFAWRLLWWCNLRLRKNGVVMIAALNATNAKDYSDELKIVAGETDFECLMSENSLNHKFRIVNK